MKKWTLGLVCMAFSVGILAADTTTYSKDQSGKIQALTTLKDDQAANDVLGQLSGQMNQIDQKMKQDQDELIALAAQKIALQAQIDSLINAKK